MGEHKGVYGLVSEMIESGEIEASRIDFLVLWKNQYLLFSQLSERDKIWYKALIELERKLDKEMVEWDQNSTFWERLGIFFMGH